ncbi:MAG: ABC transporter permease subunit [Bacteroidaceae bacterium]|nr:ABC transporter permease subunit [Bacteroidaceae bacterium]
MKQFRLLALLALLLVSCSESKEPRIVELNSEADVSGLKVAVQAGSIYDFEMSKRSDVTVARYNNAPDIVAAVISGQVDVFKDDENAMSPSDLRRHHLRLELRCEESFDVAYAFRKGDFATASQFDAFLDEIHNNGIYDEVYHRWYDTEYPDTVSLPQIAQFETGQPLRIVTHLIMAPLCFLKGDTWTGFEMELLKRFAASIKRPIEVSYLDPASGSAALQSGLADVWSGSIFITEERAQMVQFGKPYTQCHPAYFVYDGLADAANVGLWEGMKESFRKNLIEEDRWRFIVDGLWETIKISILSLLLGTLLAGIVCWMRMSRQRWLRVVASTYIDILRGVPLLVILMLMFYVVLAGSGLSATAVAVVSFALVFAAYVSEIFRTAIKSVGKGQTEAGVALGFTPFQTFIYIVLPQAASAVLPVYKGEAVSLFKNTSIVGYIAIQDLTKASDLIRSRTFDAFFPLIIISIIYFVLAWLLGKLLDQTVKTKES